MQSQLPRRSLGDTGLDVSVIGFGASPLGGVFSDIDEAVCIDAVLEAFRLGINLFDTSPYYGDTRSETVLGRALVQLPREEIIVATKVGRYGGDSFDFSGERVTRSVHESLKRLQIPYIDLIQCHDIEFGDLDQVVSETIPALLQLKEQGLVRHIGITGLPLAIFRYVLDRVEPGSVAAVLSYCHFTPSDQTLLELLPYLQEKRVGVINASVLCMGLFTPQGPPSWHPAPPQLKAAAAQAVAAAAAHGVSLPRLAMIDAVRAPGIATHLVGLATPEQVREAVDAALQGLGLVPRPAVAAEVTAAAEVAAILAPVKGLGWASGRPENN